MTWQPLCRLDALEDGGSQGFPAPPGSFIGLFAVRQAGTVYAYLNSCPHIGVPLDWLPNRFLSTNGQRIICAMHGAEFTIADGQCIAGPCLGDHLQPVPVRIEGDMVLVQDDALR